MGVEAASATNVNTASASGAVPVGVATTGATPDEGQQRVSVRYLISSILGTAPAGPAAQKPALAADTAGASMPANAGQTVEAVAKPAEAATAARDAGLWDEALGALNTLVMHIDRLPRKLHLDPAGLQKLSEQESLPADLRAALVVLAKDEHQNFVKCLDTADKGGDWDGRCSKGDLLAMAQTPRFQAFRQQRAAAYEQAYVPSDSANPSAAPRPMQASDAFREIYLYSDSLPDKLDRKALEDVVEGRVQKKCPPQLIAAARFMLQHDDAFNKLPTQNVKAGDVEDCAARQLTVRPEEAKAMQVLKDNAQKLLAGGTLTRKRLEEIAADPGQPGEVRDAARLVAGNALVFGLLDNAKNGHRVNHRVKTNDGKIGLEDLQVVVIPPVAKPPEPKRPAAPAAAAGPAVSAEVLAEMRAGVADDPDIKKPKGGPKPSLLARIFKVVAEIARPALEVLKAGLDAATGFLPPILKPITMGLSAAVAGVKTYGLAAAEALVNGHPIADALKNASTEFLTELASTALSAIPAGAALGAAALGAKAGAMAGSRFGAKLATQEAAATAGTKAAGAGAEKGISHAGAEVAQQSSTAAAKTAGLDAGKETAVDEAKTKVDEKLGISSRIKQEADKGLGLTEKKEKAGQALATVQQKAAVVAAAPAQAVAAPAILAPEPMKAPDREEEDRHDPQASKPGTRPTAKPAGA